MRLLTKSAATGERGAETATVFARFCGGAYAAAGAKNQERGPPYSRSTCSRLATVAKISQAAAC